MHYDHISFHEDHYPADLPAENALHHMGFYYAWAVSQNLYSAAAATLPQFADLQTGTISGAEFVQNQLNGGIDDTCFNELGNLFTQYYYADEEDGYGNFLADYFVALGLERDDDFYRVANTPDNQTKLNAVFQAAFDTWKGSLKP
ncbi:hypothetical protein MIS45_08500 [Wielerella bovis]|uniref:DUF7832 domain-containing protein n=1 Tax=Wielerella bovis TaxID=2917790 RepID=UPI00201A0547|nr:hypothetical protein [Wielerella bovis]ULJ68813.1 hypothetical protein MIS45_08500 [Wielerella bovis]